MKIKNFILTLMVLLVVSAFSGFSMNRNNKVENAQDSSKQVNQGVKNAKTGFDKEWHKFKNDAELKINANEKRIDEFKVKIKTTSREVKAEYEKEVVVLEQKNSELRKKISEYKYQGKDKWEEFKKGFNRDMDIVGKALRDLFAKKD
jgi:F0F1-type ATP synthase membrane subunit b/b'